MSPFSHGVFFIFLETCILHQSWKASGMAFKLRPDGLTKNTTDWLKFQSVFTGNLQMPTVLHTAAQRNQNAKSVISDDPNFHQSSFQPQSNGSKMFIKDQINFSNKPASSSLLPKPAKTYRMATHDIITNADIQRTYNRTDVSYSSFHQMLDVIKKRSRLNNSLYVGKSDKTRRNRTEKRIFKKQFKDEENGNFVQNISFVKIPESQQHVKRSSQRNHLLQKYKFLDSTISTVTPKMVVPLTYKTKRRSKRRVKDQARRQQKMQHKKMKKLPITTELNDSAEKQERKMKPVVLNHELSHHQQTVGSDDSRSQMLSKDKPATPVKLHGQDSQVASVNDPSLVTENPGRKIQASTPYLGLDGKPVNLTEFIKFLEEKDFQRRLNREAQWAYMCIVAVICLMMLAMWCLGGLQRCRLRANSAVDFSGSQFLMNVHEVVRRQQRYLSSEPEWEEVLMADRGTDP